MVMSCNPGTNAVSVISCYLWKFMECRREYKDRTTTILPLFRTSYPGTFLFPFVSCSCIFYFVVHFNILIVDIAYLEGLRIVSSIFGRPDTTLGRYCSAVRRV